MTRVIIQYKENFDTYDVLQGQISLQLKFKCFDYKGVSKIAEV